MLFVLFCFVFLIHIYIYIFLFKLIIHSWSIRPFSLTMLERSMSKTLWKDSIYFILFFLYALLFIWRSKNWARLLANISGWRKRSRQPRNFLISRQISFTFFFFSFFLRTLFRKPKIFRYFLIFFFLVCLFIFPTNNITRYF